MDTGRLLGILPAIAGALLAGGMFRQVRRPSGWLGRGVVWMMNRSHASLTAWGLEQVQVPKDATVLDAGCGGGSTVRRLAALASEGTVIGVDYSAASVAVSRRVNARGVEGGRVGIVRASVVGLPFADRTFNLVTAVETHYYWPDLPANVREIGRVLKAGGRFVLIAETYRDGPWGMLSRMLMPLLRAALLSDQEHRDLLVQAGFIEVATVHVPGKAWICLSGRRPV